MAVKVFPVEGNKHTSDYCETWACKYEFQDQDGFWKKGVIQLCTASKGRHKEVEAYFRKHYPEFTLLSVQYQ